MQASDRTFLHYLVPALYVQIMLRTLKECNEHALLTKIKQTLPWITEHLARKEDFPLAKFIRITDIIAREASRPDIGLDIGQRLTINTHGIQSDLCTSAPTLGHALDNVSRFYKLSMSFFEISTERFNGEYLVSIVNLPIISSPLSQFLLDMVMSSYDQNISYFTNKTKNISKIWFPTPPTTYKDRYRSLLGCDTEFDCDTFKVSIPLELLEHKSPLHCPELYEEYLEYCHLKSVDIEKGASLSGKIEKLIAENLSVDWSLALAADELGFSVSTLTRRLRLERVTFKKIQNTVKFDIAKKWLDREDKRIIDIAQELGFMDASNFTTAFKRWAGITPSEYRSRHK